MALPDGYRLASDLGDRDFDAAHAMLTESYWSPGISLEKVRRAAANSALVLAVRHEGQLVGYARVVSDRVRFAYLCDVIVHPDHQGRGLGRALARAAMDHPDFESCRWLLATRDAQGVYAPLGFAPIEKPENWMEHKPASYFDCLQSCGDC